MGRMGSGIDWVRQQSICTRMVADTSQLRRGDASLRPGQCIIHGCGLHRPWITPANAEGRVKEGSGKLLNTSDQRAHERLGWRRPAYHRFVHRSPEILQEMSYRETRPDTSLLDMRPLCAEDGPSLSLASHLPGPAQLQGFRAISDLRVAFQLGMFGQFGLVDVERTV